MPSANEHPLAAIARHLRNALAISIGFALVVACTGVSLSTQVISTWKDPKYTSAPLKKIFVVSLMKIEPGGRDAVEDAVVARLASAGVAGIASHSVMSNDPQRPGPSLSEAIAAAGADGVLLVDVRAIGSYEPYTIGQTLTSLSPDTMASYSYLKREGADQSGDYKVAHIVSELYLPSMGKQVWTAFTNSYDAANLARNMPDYTLKLVTVMAKDRIIDGAPAPRS
jgi:hypothetical protein